MTTETRKNMASFIWRLPVGNWQLAITRHPRGVFIRDLVDSARFPIKTPQE